MPEEMIEEAEAHIRDAWGVPAWQPVAARIDGLMLNREITGNDVIALVASAMNRSVEA